MGGNLALLLTTFDTRSSLSEVGRSPNGPWKFYRRGEEAGTGTGLVGVAAFAVLVIIIGYGCVHDCSFMSNTSLNQNTLDAAWVMHCQILCGALVGWWRRGGMDPRLPQVF